MKLNCLFEDASSAEEILRKILNAAANDKGLAISIRGVEGPPLPAAYVKAIAKFYEMSPKYMAKEKFLQLFDDPNLFVQMLKDVSFKKLVAYYKDAESYMSRSDAFKPMSWQGKTQKDKEFEPFEMPNKSKTGFTDFDTFMKKSAETVFPKEPHDIKKHAAAAAAYKTVSKMEAVVLDKFIQNIITEVWDDSAAKDAEGRWAKYRDGKIGVTAMAKWLYSSRVHKSTKADKLKSAYGAIAQQQNTSKLISAAKADALRAELKKLYQA